MNAYLEKLRSISFGTVPGGYKDENSKTMFDTETLKSQFAGADGVSVFNREKVEDNRSDFAKAQKEFLDADV